MFNYALSDNGAEVEFKGIHQNEVYAQRATEFVAAHGNQPFLLTVSSFSPHWTFCGPGIPGRCPPQPTPQDLGTFAGTKFPFDPSFTKDKEARAEANFYWQRELESLQSVDRMVGALVAQLRAQGELRDTYVIFQSDNGMLHGERGTFDKNVPWDRSVRVPLVIRGYGFEPGSRRRDLTANVDVPATILDAAGVRPPLPADGHSLLSRHRRKILLLERLIGSEHPLAGLARHPWLQLKTATGWAYWRDRVSGREFLYDRDSDPRETRNLARRKPAVTARLSSRLARIESCAAPCP
jgi:arylsulfatase A-like enzyme